MRTGRKRMVHLAMWESPSFTRLDPLAKLVWVGLITMADDDGRLRANANLVRNKLFPYDPEPTAEDVDGAIEAIAAQEDEDGRPAMLELYRNGGERLGQLVHWMEHQTIKHYKPSTLPAAGGNSGAHEPPKAGPSPAPNGAETAPKAGPNGARKGPQSNITQPNLRNEEKAAGRPGPQPKRPRRARRKGPVEKRAASGMINPVSYAAAIFKQLSTQERRAWAGALSVAKDWGPSTNQTLADLRKRLAGGTDERTLGMMVEVRRRKRKRPWGALVKRWEEDWGPTDEDLKEAHDMLYPDAGKAETEHCRRLDDVLTKLMKGIK